MEEKSHVFNEIHMEIFIKTFSQCHTNLLYPSVTLPVTALYQTQEHAHYQYAQMQ